jgi:hypothetical protein
MTRRALALLICYFLGVGIASGSEFRSIQSFSTPSSSTADAAGMDTSQAFTPQLQDLAPISRQVVEDAVRQLLGTWNSPEMAQLLDSSFVDKSRFLYASDDKTKVPPDAVIRLLSTRGIRTLNRRLETDASGQYFVVSTVSATITTQIEFNDALEGFQRIEGKNEIIFEITEQLK